MKVYYQELNGQKCVCDNIEDLRHDLEIALDEFVEIALDEFEELEIDETELKKIIDRNIEEISKLKIGESIELYGFRWGAMEMSKEEFENLGEFLGW